VSDEKANIFEVQYLHGRHRRICARHKRDSECALPGEICFPAMSYRRREAMG
jgi:hypothetical protein